MLTIRLMNHADLDELSLLFSEVYNAPKAGERMTNESSYKLLEYFFNRQPDLAYVAEESGTLVGGFLADIKPWGDGNHLNDGEIFVHPNFQNQGIGNELLKSVFEKALEKYQVTSFDSHTFRKSTFPLSWYKRLGFKELDEWVMIAGDVKKALSIINEKSV